VRDLLVPLVAAELDLVGVDHDDEVTGIDVRGPGRLLAAESVRAIIHRERAEALPPAASTIYQSCVASAVVCW